MDVRHYRHLEILPYTGQNLQSLLVPDTGERSQDTAERFAFL